MAETPIKNRIRQFCSYLQMTDRDFQSRAGVGDGFMARQSEPVGGAIASILRAFPQLSPDWLLLDRGTMLRDLSIKNLDYAVPNEQPLEQISEIQPYGVKSDENITIPRTAYDALVAQLKVKDQQLQDAAAQIATLLQLLNNK